MISSINDIEKKRGRGRPKTDSVPVLVRLSSADVAALDAHIERQPEPKPSRPEAIRRVLAENLSGKRATTATSPDVAEKAAKVRSKAANAADEAMTGIEAPAEVKEKRRRAITEKPPMVAKARAKRKAQASERSD